MATHTIILRIYFDDAITNFEKVVDDIKKHITGVKDVTIRERI